ncbi:MAG: hypothetical protein AABX38_01090 [Candidatus Micrarchaeota archaeon]
MKNSFIHNLKARGQIFTGLIGDYVKVRPERVIFSPFSRTFPLEDRKYYIRDTLKDNLLVPLGIQLGIFEPVDYQAAVALLEVQPELRIFPRLISLGDEETSERLKGFPEEIREITSSLYFRKAMPRSDLRQAEELASKPFPTIDEIVHIGLPLDLNDPEVRKLQFKLNNAHIQFVADRITVANNLGQRSVHQLDHLDVPKQEEKELIPTVRGAPKLKIIR